MILKLKPRWIRRERKQIDDAIAGGWSTRAWLHTRMLAHHVFEVYPELREL